MVNKAKSAIFFSVNCTEEMKVATHNSSGIEVEALIEKYLGLSTAISRSSESQSEHIVTQIRKLVNGWAPKLMSSAAQEVLIKSICQAIPTYSMGCFTLSKKTCKKITSIVARFWWGGDEKKKKMH